MQQTSKITVVERMLNSQWFTLILWTLIDYMGYLKHQGTREHKTYPLSDTYAYELYL